MSVDADGHHPRPATSRTSTTPARSRCRAARAGPLVGMLFTGPYKVQHLGWSSTTVYTNTCGRAAYRGPWMMETAAREEMLDHVAREIGLDPLEFRRRNVLQTSDLPYMCPGGMNIELVTPAETLEQVAAELGYDAFRAEQAKATAEGRLPSASASRSTSSRRPTSARTRTEPANIRMHANGRVEVFIGSGAHGQGLETTTAQLVAENLGVDYADVTVRQGDTERALRAGHRRQPQRPMIGQAVTEASLLLRDKVVAIAAHLLEASPDDLEVAEGVVSVKGTPTKSVAGRAGGVGSRTSSRARLPPELDRTLEVGAPQRRARRACGRTRATRAIVEVDPATGRSRSCATS